MFFFQFIDLLDSRQLSIFFFLIWTFEMFMHFLFDILNFWKLIIGFSFFEDVAQHGRLACTCKYTVYI